MLSFHVIEFTRPLLVMRFPRVVDAHVLAAMMAAYDRAHQRGTHFATVLDASEILKLPGPDERKELMAWLRDETRLARERELDVGAAIVVRSRLVRAFVAAAYFVRKPAAPQRWTTSVEEAVDWACTRLQEAGVALNRDIEAMRREAVGR